MNSNVFLMNFLFFKFCILQALIVVIAVIAVVSAVPAPVDETVIGEVYGQHDSVSAQEPSEFFKLKKLKKLLFG